VGAARADGRRLPKPAKAADSILLATRNIANLGLQKRRDQDYRPRIVSDIPPTLQESNEPRSLQEFPHWA
jgi:hypothetical protein